MTERSAKLNTVSFETPLIAKIRTVFKRPEMLISAILSVTSSILGLATVKFSGITSGVLIPVALGALVCFYLYYLFDALGLIMIYCNARKKTGFLSTSGLTFNIFIKIFVTVVLSGSTQWLVWMFFYVGKISRQYFLIFTAINLTYIVLSIFYIIMLARIIKTVKNNYPHIVFSTVCLIYTIIKTSIFVGAITLSVMIAIKQSYFSLGYWRFYVFVFTMLLCAICEILKFVLMIKYKKSITFYRILVKQQNV
ncbi:MAG: hypothetical protein Q4B04_00770 [bacterium]|nr:hypothetical protein [bacterium]